MSFNSLQSQRWYSGFSQSHILAGSPRGRAAREAGVTTTEGPAVAEAVAVAVAVAARGG